MVDEHAVHTLFVGVEEADVLTKHVDDDGGVPRVGVLVIPGQKHADEYM